MGFLRKKNKAIKEIAKERIDAFLADYRGLVAKHKLDIGAELFISPNGIVPRMVVKEVQGVLNDSQVKS